MSRCEKTRRGGEGETRSKLGVAEFVRIWWRAGGPRRPCVGGTSDWMLQPDSVRQTLPTDPVSVEAMTECYDVVHGLQLSVVGPTGTGPVETIAADLFSLASSRAPTDAGSVESATGAPRVDRARSPLSARSALQIENCKLKIANWNSRRCASQFSIFNFQFSIFNSLDEHGQARTPRVVSQFKPAWRGFLSLRDPAALSGRPGHPVGSAPWPRPEVSRLQLRPRFLSPCLPVSLSPCLPSKAPRTPHCAAAGRQA